MSIYQKLKQNPIEVKVNGKNPREVHFDIVSVMCDNKKRISFTRQENGTYEVSGNGYCLSNFQIPHDRVELCWAAEDGEWGKVAKMINEGVVKVSRVRSR